MWMMSILCGSNPRMVESMFSRICCWGMVVECFWLDVFREKLRKRSSGVLACCMSEHFLPCRFLKFVSKLLHFESDGEEWGLERGSGARHTIKSKSGP